MADTAEATSLKRCQPSLALPLAILILAVMYAAPHLWWMAGISYAFPGDAADFEEAFERAWFSVYNLVTTGMVIGGALAVVVLERYRGLRWRRAVWVLVLLGSIALLLRGVLGIVTSIPVTSSTTAWFWELWFLTTGLLYALGAWRNKDASRGVAEERR